jgi:hypothetical protein
MTEPAKQPVPLCAVCPAGDVAEAARRVARATVDGRPATAAVEVVEKSRYAVLSVDLHRPRKVRIAYG